jgi:hypothetical protein
MIPVVMLAINTGVFFPLFIMLFCFTVTCPSFVYILVIYLIIVVGGAINIFFSRGTIQMYITLDIILTFSQVAQVVLSLLINIFAMSITALKAWCVRIHGVFPNHCVDVDCTLINNITCTYIQEILQVAEGKWDRYPNS